MGDDRRRRVNNGIKQNVDIIVNRSAADSLQLNLQVEKRVGRASGTRGAMYIRRTHNDEPMQRTCIKKMLKQDPGSDTYEWAAYFTIWAIGQASG